jgi:flagellar secretion chaperone FliS
MDVGSEYRQLSAQGISKIRIVIALYDQMVKDINRAIAAMGDGNVEARSREIHHAFTIIEQLQGRLDHQTGGEIANNLDRFYSLLRTRLLEAQISKSPEILQEQMAQLLSLRDAWLEIARIEERNSEAVTPPTLAGSPGDANAVTGQGWEA